MAQHFFQQLAGSVQWAIGIKVSPQGTKLRTSVAWAQLAVAAIREEGSPW